MPFFKKQDASSNGKHGTHRALRLNVLLPHYTIETFIRRVSDFGLDLFSIDEVLLPVGARVEYEYPELAELGPMRGFAYVRYSDGRRHGLELSDD